VDSPAPASQDDSLDAFVHQVVKDWRRCPLRPAVQHLLAFIEKMTRSPSQMTQAEVSALCEAGWSDRAVHDAVQLASYFNYINRVADALGVAPETDRPVWGRS